MAYQNSTPPDNVNQRPKRTYKSSKTTSTHKKCPGCKEVKRRSEFGAHKRTLIPRGYCKSCERLKQRAKYAARRLPIEPIIGETWRDIKRYEGLYKVSDMGRVQRLEGFKCARARILKPHVVKGYPTVYLSKNSVVKGFMIHGLVAVAFLGPYPEGMEVNHIDHNRANPKLNNLEYRTHQKNMEYAAEQGRFHAKPRIKLTAQDIPKIRAMIQEGLSIPSIAAAFHASHGAITGIKHGHNWKHIR